LLLQTPSCLPKQCYWVHKTVLSEKIGLNWTGFKVIWKYLNWIGFLKSNWIVNPLYCGLDCKIHVISFYFSKQRNWTPWNIMDPMYSESESVWFVFSFCILWSPNEFVDIVLCFVPKLPLAFLVVLVALLGRLG